MKVENQRKLKKMDKERKQERQQIWQKEKKYEEKIY
jgi:hypothetical protein